MIQSGRPVSAQLRMNSPLPHGPLVACRNLGVRRDSRWLVRGVDLEVGTGEIVSIVGPNGGGKTTLIKALIGIERINAGSVERRPGLRIGYVPQRLAIDRTMPLTVSRLMTLVRRASPEAVSAALARTGVDHLTGRPVQVLSGGEMQRVLIARALLGSPDLLVLDEPVQSVDFSGQLDLYQLIAGLRDSLGCGVLMVSHDLHVVMRATDRVLCLAGHVCCTGVPRDVSRNPEYLRMFGPGAADALAVYPHSHDHRHDPSGAVIEADRHRHHHHDHDGRHADDGPTSAGDRAAAPDRPARERLDAG
ncbi:zinc transport system ATP-binding protein [Tepidamorphus gemmatus]|uniref:Zinc transport system ATP-binding protein n=2 Tax=Tepidamorphus gemmatus TaxID=747076 RepID=A0A4R3MH95_9HYPH|nr:zinc transport system ATP-binding protein [Tepidamorphus gemmatus]